MRVGRALAAAFGGAGVVGCAYVSSDPARREHVSGTLTGLGRFSRTLYYGARAAADYKFVLGPAEARLGVASEEYQALRKVIDQRNADRMLYVCKLHAAFYTKIGQYISTLNHALPPEYTSTLAELQDKARFRPWEDMERVLIEDFGKPSSELFASIETTPIAAASLAQVHRAVAHDGTKLAVKIQYPDLRRMAQNDLASMKILFELVEVLFPDYGFVWLFPEFKSTVAAEINFLQEARNGERVAAQFADDKRFHIPFVRRDLTTDRVLSMELIEGAKVSDKAWMKARRVDPSAVASSVVDFFASQVHEKGMVHCDPHPGNLMLRDNPDKSYGAQPWQLVVIDHGMYRRLTPQFRSAYCRLWRAVLLQDEVEGGAACVGLGLRADEYDAMSLILTNRPAKSKNGIGARMTKKDAMETWDKYGRVTVGDVNRFMQRLPRDLLFVSRNANLVRSLNMDLGGTSRDRFKAHGRAAVAGLVLNDALARAGVASGVVESLSGSGGAGADIVEEATASIFASLAALAGRPPPKREPLSYVNAIARGTLMDHPTEYELLAAARAARGGKGTGQLSLARRVHVWWQWARMEATLAVVDAAAAVSAYLHGTDEVWTSPSEAARNHRASAGNAVSSNRG